MTDTSDKELSPQADQEGTPRTVSSSELLQGARMMIIEHAGQSYRLTITKNDKLILQK